MKVNELAKRAGVTAETVRHYAREQLLDPQRHPDNGYQLFSDTDLERLRFIQRDPISFGRATMATRCLDHKEQCPGLRNGVVGRSLRNRRR